MPGPLNNCPKPGSAPLCPPLENMGGNNLKEGRLANPPIRSRDQMWKERNDGLVQAGPIIIAGAPGRRHLAMFRVMTDLKILARSLQ